MSAPERIWAWKWAVGDNMGQWSDTDPREYIGKDSASRCFEYVRADVAAAVGLRIAAKMLCDRADEIERGSSNAVTGRGMAQIYREEADAILAAIPPHSTPPHGR